MHNTNKQEQFSCAYIMAVAAKAGCVLGELRVDNDSVDWVIRRKLDGRMNPRPQIDVQLKCTHNLVEKGENYKFALKKKNYDDLRIANVSQPRILVVVSIPTEDHLWLSQTESELTLRKCSYWISIEGKPKSVNKANVTIDIPKINVFSPFSLLTLLEKVANGEKL